MKYLVTKTDRYARVAHYETASGIFSKNILEAASFPKKTAEKHVENIQKGLSKFMRERITVTVLEV